MGTEAGQIVDDANAARADLVEAAVAARRRIAEDELTARSRLIAAEETAREALKRSNEAAMNSNKAVQAVIDLRRDLFGNPELGMDDRGVLGRLEQNVSTVSRQAWAVIALLVSGLLGVIGVLLAHH